MTSLSRLIIGAAVLFIAACNSGRLDPKSYDDCVLSYSADSKTNAALVAVKISCKSKFPMTFDFDQIARTANVKPWTEVAKNADFIAADRKLKKKARVHYFEDFVKPRVHADFSDEAFAQFDAYTRGIEKSVRDTADEATD